MGVPPRLLHIMEYKTYLQEIFCMISYTYYLYKDCEEKSNFIVVYRESILLLKVDNLNKMKQASEFHTDLYLKI